MCVLRFESLRAGRWRAPYHLPRGPGEGELEFGPILAALRDGGYDGNAAIEPFIYQPDGPTCAARGIGYIRGIMETL